ncbi:MAG: tripartite tricarboxylate transporter substrate binding protein [Burkholderiales bacterium]|nr:tripartite tricarboxylate transporter substrate binding protein [Burkholderiales bacterium]
MHYRFGGCLFAAALLFAAGAAQAQPSAYPSRAVSMIVPTGAGGGTDVVARLMSKQLGELLGQPVVVENKAGAGGVIGTQLAARAAPDGHTVLISSNQIAMIPHLYKTPPFDTKEFAPLTSLVIIPTVVVVNPKVPVKNVRELVELAKSKPGELSYASAGNGSPNHLFAELLNMKAGVKILHVPYKGIAPALADVVAGNVAMAYASLPTVQAFLDSGRLRALAVTSSKRIPTLPDVPTVAESVPGYEADIWIGLWGVAGTPAPILSKLHQSVIKTLADPEVKRRLLDAGMVIDTRSAESFDKMVRAESDRWAQVIKGLASEITLQ